MESVKCCLRVWWIKLSVAVSTDAVASSRCKFSTKLCSTRFERQTFGVELSLNFSNHWYAYKHFIITPLVSKLWQIGLANCPNLTTNMMWNDFGFHEAKLEPKSCMLLCICGRVLITAMTWLLIIS